MRKMTGADKVSKRLRAKIVSRKARIAVIGLGYVCLPLAVNFAKKGFRVFGLDTDIDRVRSIQKKTSYILDIPSRALAGVVASGHLSAATTFDCLRTVDCIIICVPTPLKRKYTPDITYILNAVRTIRAFIKKDTLVVLESTTYPGTTEELIKPELEKSGLRSGKDFFLAFSPERIDPGNKTHDVTNITKVVGGLTPASGELTKLLYEQIIKRVHMVSTAKAAEMTKLLENTFRIINIGWANEAAMMCHKMDIDVWEVIDAAKTKPFGFMPFYPGLGVGGHCIPAEPLYLYWKSRHHGFSSKFIKLSADTNAHMPAYTVTRIKEALKKKTLAGTKVLVLGVTYKKDVKDLRKSPPLRLLELFKEARCRVEYYDPIIPFLKILGIQMKAIALTKANLSKFDCVVIATDHTRVNYALVLKNARLIFDARNVYKGVRNKKVVKL